MTLELDSPEPSVLSLEAGVVARFLPALVALKMVWSSGPRTEPAGSRRMRRALAWSSDSSLLSGFVTEGAISLYEGGLGVT